MKKITYTIIIAICTIIMSGALTGTGYFLGISQDFMLDMNSVSNLEKETTKASMIFRQIQYLEKGEIEKIRQLLNTQLDSSIATLDVIIENYPKSQEEDRNSSVKLLHRIAKHRKQYPKSFSSLSPTQKDIDVDGIIDEILEKHIK